MLTYFKLQLRPSSVITKTAQRWLTINILQQKLQYDTEPINSNFRSCLIPEEIKNLEPIELNQLTCGLHHYAAIINNQLYTWGSNEYGQLGPTNTSFSLMDSGSESEDLIESPFLLPGAINFKKEKSGNGYQLVAGDFHTLCLDRDTNQIWSWGAGILGRGAEVYDPLPSTIDFFNEAKVTISKILAAGDYSIAVGNPNNPEYSSRDLVYIWGYLPNTDNCKSYYPVLVQNLLDQEIKFITSDRHGFLAVSKNKNEKYYLKWFGNENKDEFEEVPYYPNYSEDAKVLTGYSSKPAFSIEITKELINEDDAISKVILGGNGIAGILLKNKELIMVDLKNKSELKIVKFKDVNKAQLTFNFLILNNKENELKVVNLNTLNFRHWDKRGNEGLYHNQIDSSVEKLESSANDITFSGDKLICL
ncbi:RCC1/BLIP-II [Neoconidiobolus thromboides FSU 785]|nr:RCC1/BLIP-II [Neoconidiobolus thromboides FSU 785]